MTGSERPTQTVDVMGLATSYRRDGAGEALLFLVGPRIAGRWLPLHAALAGAHDVIAPDHPGHGDTPLPDSLTDMSDLVIHYAALLDALELPAVHLVGHGFGGWLAAEIAAFYPERVGSLTLLAPWGLRPDPDEPLANFFRTTDDEELALALGTDAARWHDELIDANAGAQAVRTFEERLTIARVAWNPRYDLKLPRRLARVGAPALVVVPEHDGIVPPSVATQYRDALADARLETITGQAVTTEHLFVLQEPDAVASAITALTTTRELA